MWAACFYRASALTLGRRGETVGAAIASGLSHQTNHSETRGADVEAESPLLYERLGGIYSIATVIDDFIDRIMVDDRLNANPRVDEAHHRVLPPGFKYLVTEQLADASGGPQRYSGRPMEESHREMQITAAEWDAFIDDLNHTLDKFKVPDKERSEVLAIIESTRDDIVA
jgi:hemoglobin